MNKNDRKIAVAALCVATLSLVLLYLFDGHTTSPTPKDATPRYAKRHKEARRTAYYGSYPKEQRKETFPFDPNTADSTQLLRLGLQPWQVRNIYKYRAAGGIYRTKEDRSRTIAAWNPTSASAATTCQPRHWWGIGPMGPMGLMGLMGPMGLSLTPGRLTAPNMSC